MHVLSSRKLAKDLSVDDSKARLRRPIVAVGSEFTPVFFAASTINPHVHLI